MAVRYTYIYMYVYPPAKQSLEKTATGHFWRAAGIFAGYLPETFL